MILPFSTKINGKPNYFVEKIWAGLEKINGIDIRESEEFNNTQRKYYLKWGWDEFAPKIHTIREDKKNRWKAAVNIDFFINCRKPDMFRFAPVLPVINIQSIEIIHYHNSETLNNGLAQKKVVFIDERPLYTDELITLAQNDGFDTIEDFFAYFNTDFKGKIIHWTNFKYL